MDYTLAQMRGFAAAIERRDAAQARLDLIIARAAWADREDYEKLWRALGVKE